MTISVIEIPPSWTAVLLSDHSIEDSSLSWALRDSSFANERRYTGQLCPLWGRILFDFKPIGQRVSFHSSMDCRPRPILITLALVQVHPWRPDLIQTVKPPESTEALHSSCQPYSTKGQILQRLSCENWITACSTSIVSSSRFSCPRPSL